MGLDLSRRRALGAGAGAGTALLMGSITEMATAATSPRVSAADARNAPQRLLIRNATIVSMDDKVGDLVSSDILIEGTQIRDIGKSLRAADARVIDATGMIVTPGLVDSHRHCWEGQLRLFNPNSPTLDDYRNATHRSFATSYRPLDYYVGNFLSAVSCINAGITCVIDNSNNSRSPAHSDAAVQALMDSGIRAVHAAGPPQAGDWAKQWPQDLERLQKQYFASSEQLVTLGMFSRLEPANWKLARRLGIRISTEFLDPEMAPMIEPLVAQNLIGPDTTLNHCGGLPEATWKMISDTGAAVNVCPRSDAQYGLSEGQCALQQARDHGIWPGLSVDNETSYGGDMFGEMRTALFTQRAFAQNRRYKGDKSAPAPMSARDVLICATKGGARCAGLDAKIGSLAPGREADLIMIRADDLNLLPLNNAIGTVVQAAESGNVDTVIIGGRIRKHRGKVEGLDVNRLRTMVEDSRRYLFATRNFTHDLFADRLQQP